MASMEKQSYTKQGIKGLQAPLMAPPATPAQCNFLSVKVNNLIVMTTSFLLFSSTQAIALGWSPMPTGINPVVNSSDGRVTFSDEWTHANSTINNQNDGTYYAQFQKDWVATSSAGNTNVYSGITLFDMHDIWGYTSQETADYNVFEYTWGATTITGWVFANGDETDDATWIHNSGLGYDSIDDRGYLVRLNNDPLTDNQWLPGMLEPGDDGFNWGDYYGFFGSSGFNNSAFENGLSSHDGANEIYEVAFHGQYFGGEPGEPVIPCITDIFRKVHDPKSGDPQLELVGQQIGPGHVIPIPGAIWLFGSALVGFIGFRKIRS